MLSAAKAMGRSSLQPLQAISERTNVDKRVRIVTSSKVVARNGLNYSRLRGFANGDRLELS